MESITIKRLTQPSRSLVLLFVTLIPVVLFSYAAFGARKNNYGMAFGIIAMCFLLPVIIDFIANKLIPLKVAIMISEQGLMLSSSKGLYDSFAFLQLFQPQRKKLIQWQDITEFKLLVRYKYLTSYPSEGESIASTTYSVAQHQLSIKNKTTGQDVIFSVYNLDRTPDEILMLCNKFLEKHRGGIIDHINPGV